MLTLTTFHRHLSLLAALIALCCASVSQGQIAATLKLSKKQYLTGEPVLATVTVTNHAGKDLTFASDGRTQWLDFLMKDFQGQSISPRGRSIFGKLTVKAGATMAREVDLSQHFQLSRPGSFMVSAVVRLAPSVGEGATTGLESFNQVTGVPYWSQKVGIPGKSGQMRDFRILNYNGEEKAQLYAQVTDARSGQNVRTFPLGEILNLRKPVATVDRKQQLHVLYLATPTLYVHYQIDTDGKVTNRDIHQRGGEGDPQLLTMGDGSVRVGNSIPYDQKAAAENKAKIRKASDRPAGTF